MKVRIETLALIAVVGAVAGCGGGDRGGGLRRLRRRRLRLRPLPRTTHLKNVDAGIPVTESTDPKPYLRLVAASNYGHRSDPFALTSEEAAYDRQQNTERILSTMGSWKTEYVAPPDEDKTVPPEEPQPYRRLAGVVVGDSVLAIIDMGNGQTELIRPGMKIPNSEWTVVSINEDHAILHRGGDVAPHTISVRLESPPAGSMGGGGSFGGPPAGGPPMGGPPRGLGGGPGFNPGGK